MTLNPLLKHPVLQHLPIDQLRNPTIEGVRSFLSKKSKTFKLLKWVMVLAFILQIVMVFFLRGTQNEDGLNILNHIGDILGLIMPPVLAVAMQRLEKKFALSDQEILQAIQGVQTQGPA